MNAPHPPTVVPPPTTVPPVSAFDDLNGKTNFLVKQYPPGTFVWAGPEKDPIIVVNPDEDF